MKPPVGHQRVKTARKRSAQSTRWLERQLNDPYVRRAKAEGYRSRAAYKLIELDARFAFLKKARRVTCGVLGVFSMRRMPGFRLLPLSSFLSMGSPDWLVGLPPMQPCVHSLIDGSHCTFATSMPNGERTVQTRRKPAPGLAFGRHAHGACVAWRRRNPPRRRIRRRQV